MGMIRHITFIRYKHSSFGGAERYLSRITADLKQRAVPHNIFSTCPYDEHTHVITPPWFLPRFLKILWFANKTCQHHTSSLRFSLERIPCPDIYRAGDGVHKEWMRIQRDHGQWWTSIAQWLKPLNLIYLMLEKRCFHHAHTIIANSYRGKQEIMHHYGIPTDSITVIYNGIPVPKIPCDISKQKSKKTLGKEFNISLSRVPIILYVGSGFKRKGVEQMLNLLSRIHHKTFHLFVVGKDKRLSTYQKLSHARNLAHKVTFTHARDDVEQFYTVADIFLFPTFYEPFSNACLEAMAYECALITTAQNGASEIMPNKECIMRSPNDQTILPTLIRLLDDVPYRTQMQKQLRSIAQTMSVEKNVQHTLDVIRNTQESSQ
jgi:UDP-glucose:(heptosyl)LPS alpha-1,3-glucosyltransferase